MKAGSLAGWFHVIIVPRGPGSTDFRQEFELNLSFQMIEQRFLLPYRQGRAVVIDGRKVAMAKLERIRIYRTEEKVDSYYQVKDESEITQELILDPPGSELEVVRHSDSENLPAKDAREVFVVHGRNLAARDAIFVFLRAIGLQPLEWSQAIQFTGRTSPYIGEILDAAFSRAHAVVVLMTPDDEAYLSVPLRNDNDPSHETELTGQARPNVLFEAGMAMGRSEDRTILVELGRLRPFSDIGGRHVIRLNDTSQRRQELAQRLEAAGCPVNLSGTDWHTAGNFDEALERAERRSSELGIAMGEQLAVVGTPLLSEEAKEVLIGAASGEPATILKLEMASGAVAIKAGSKQINVTQDAREKAKWEAAIDELVDQGFVRVDDDGRVFEVTHRGFQHVDQLSQSNDFT